MPCYVFTGSVTKHGVVFFIDADTPQEAIERAKKADFDEYDDHGADTADWFVDPNSMGGND